jgi:hypothetical protein
MSYDLCCWRYTTTPKESAQATYERLSEGDEVDGLALLPVAEIKTRFIEFFPSIEDYGMELNWEGDRGAFQVIWSIASKPQHTLAWFVLCSWSLLEEPEVMARIVEVASAIGCGVYDPQKYQRQAALGENV